ncbi:hypothetical protein, partial [Pseudomonas sp. S32]|uniref:hypothetical protein n=1 Tax=Pseudomonas sp. S32 TaxID=2767448 RepID=UPI001F167955
AVFQEAEEVEGVRVDDGFCGHGNSMLHRNKLNQARSKQQRPLRHEVRAPYEQASIRLDLMCITAGSNAAIESIRAPSNL